MEIQRINEYISKSLFYFHEENFGKFKEHFYQSDLGKIYKALPMLELLDNKNPVFAAKCCFTEISLPENTNYCADTQVLITPIKLPMNLSLLLKVHCKIAFSYYR
jgi:hypothetical protein